MSFRAYLDRVEVVVALTQRFLALSVYSRPVRSWGLSLSTEELVRESVSLLTSHSLRPSRS